MGPVSCTDRLALASPESVRSALTRVPSALLNGLKVTLRVQSPFWSDKVRVWIAVCCTPIMTIVAAKLPPKEVKLLPNEPPPGAGSGADAVFYGDCGAGGGLGAGGEIERAREGGTGRSGHRQRHLAGADKGCGRELRAGCADRVGGRGALRVGQAGEGSAGGAGEIDLAVKAGEVGAGAD